MSYTNLSTLELALVFIILVIGIIGHFTFHSKNASRKKKLTWSTTIYGAAIILLICSLITPPDILSSAMVSLPLTVAYILLINKLWLSRIK